MGLWRVEHKYSAGGAWLADRHYSRRTVGSPQFMPPARRRVPRPRRAVRCGGVDLALEERVGVGSVCRRQGTRDADAIMRAVAGRGIRVHAFGVKSDGLKLFGDVIASADSMAWSYVARKRPIRMAGHTHVNCGNCYEWALTWRARMLSQLPCTFAAG